MLSNIRLPFLSVCRARISLFSNMNNHVAASQQRLQDASRLLATLKTELAELKKLKATDRANALQRENEDLREQVKNIINHLSKLETQNGKKQIPIPNQNYFNDTIVGDSIKNTKPIEIELKNATKATDIPVVPKPVKESKPKKEKKPPAEKTETNTDELPIDVGRLDFRVGRIVEVNKHPDADSLYVEKVDCGEPQPRTVVSGLVKHIPIEEMQNRLVVLLCNLKPAKMRGITSEAMVMCASTPEKVEILNPPVGCEPGDLVHCDGFPRKPDVQLNPKKKIFETCAPDLHTNSDKEACFKNAPLTVPGKGKIVSQTLSGVSVR